MIGEPRIPGQFYVTVKEARRTGFLLGPYPDYFEAANNVDRGRELACKVDSFAWFYAYGVARDPGPARTTRFGA